MKILMFIKRVATIRKLRKIFRDVKKESLTVRERAAKDIARCSLELFLKRYGKEVREVNIFYEGKPQRHSPAYPGEQPLRREVWPIRKFLDKISVTKEEGLFLLVVCARLQP